MRETKVIPPRVPFLDQRTGTIAREWYLFLLNLTNTSDVTVVEVDTMQAEMIVVQGEVDVLQSEVDTLQAEMIVVQGEVDVLQSEVAALNDEVIIYPLLLMGA